MDVINTVNNALKHARRDQDSESTFHTPLLNEERPSHAQYQRPKKWLPIFLRPLFVTGLALLMIVLGVGVQVALARSQQSEGFRVRGLDSFGGMNFLKAFLPVIFVMPIAWLWTKVDQALVNMHPYVVLSKGRAPADKSLLIDYSGNRFGIIFKALRNRHWLVLFSSWICVANMALSPLASGLLTSKPSEYIIPNIAVQSLKSLGLNPNLDTLEASIAAAGFVQAATLHNLTDPAFVQDGWAVADFKMPEFDRDVNGSVAVPTTAIRSTPGCSKADSFTLMDGQTGGARVTGTGLGCQVAFDIPNSSLDQAAAVPLTTCADVLPDAPFRPIVFWMFSPRTRQATVTFCKPTIDVFNVVAEADLGGENKVLNVTIVDQNVAANNVTGSPQNSRAFNGIAFDLTNANALVQARAAAIQIILPSAIMRAAIESPGGMDATIADPLTTATITNKIFTQFLSVMAKSALFVHVETEVRAEMRVWENRLWIYPVAAHAFTAALAMIALFAALTHIAHARARRDVWLSCNPATIAGALSMSSHSKFPNVLDAGDSDEDLSHKLKHMSFGISRRTWQMIAEGEDEQAGMHHSRTLDEKHGENRPSGNQVHLAQHDRAPGPPPLSYPPTPGSARYFDQANV